METTPPAYRRHLTRLTRLFVDAEREVNRQMLSALAAGEVQAARGRRRRLAEITATLAQLRSLLRDGNPGERPPAEALINAAYTSGARRAVEDMAALGLSPEETPLAGMHTDAAQAAYERLLESLEARISDTERAARNAMRRIRAEEALQEAIQGRTRLQTSEAIADRLQGSGLVEMVDGRPSVRLSTAGRRWALSDYAEMAARTESRTAHTEGTLNRLGENGIDLIQITAHGGSCEICRPFENQIYSISGGGDYPRLQERPPYHPNCLLPGQLVAAPNLLSSSERWYEGEVLVIRTASGDDLACTPNHPILTSRGWVAAGDLMEGGDVIRSADLQRVMQSADPDYDEVPALIEDVAHSVGVASGVPPRRVEVAAEDFHGDGVGSEVAVIRADGFLGDGFDAAKPKQGGEPTFGPANVGGRALPASGDLDPMLQRLAPPAHRVMGGPRSRLALFGRHSGVAYSERFGRGSEGDAVLMEPMPDNGIVVCAEHLGNLGTSPALVNVEPAEHVGAGVLLAGGPASAEIGEAQTSGPGLLLQSALTDTEGGCDLLNSLAGAVEVSRVVEVERRDFVGHVYNLQTRQHWYAANGIITHNCAHVLTPYVEEYA